MFAVGRWGTGSASGSSRTDYVHFAKCRRLRKREAHNAGWAERCAAQVRDTLALLEAESARAGTPFWFREARSRADTALGCALRFTREGHPELLRAAIGPALEAHSARCKALQWLDVSARCMVAGVLGVLSACGGDDGGGAGESSGGTGAQENSGGNAGSSVSGGGGASGSSGEAGSGGSSAQGGSGSGGTAAQVSPDAEACASMAVEFSEPGAAEYVQWNVDGAEKTALPTPGGAYFFDGSAPRSAHRPRAGLRGRTPLGRPRVAARARAAPRSSRWKEPLDIHSPAAVDDRRCAVQAAASARVFTSSFRYRFFTWVCTVPSEMPRLRAHSA